MENNLWQTRFAASLEGDRKRKREWHQQHFQQQQQQQQHHSTAKPQLTACADGRINIPLVHPYQQQQIQCVDLLPQAPLPPGWQQCLDLQACSLLPSPTPTPALMSYCSLPWDALFICIQDSSPRLYIEDCTQGPAFLMSESIRGNDTYIFTVKTGRACIFIFFQSGELYYMDWSTSTRSPYDPRTSTKGTLAAAMQECGFHFQMKSTGSSMESYGHPMHTTSKEVSSEHMINAMSVTVCVHCHNFVLISRSSPCCPNCKGLCTIDQSIPP